jgi:CheY-like chemotaxis protein
LDSVSVAPVLVVEDEAMLRELLCDLLEAEGFRATTAANGAEALELIRRQGVPSLVILDLMMPVMDGWEFRRQQLADPQLQNVPVAIHTGAMPAAAELHCLQPVAVLKKPTNVADLLKVVRDFATPIH